MQMMFGAFPLIFADQRGWSSGEVGCAFLGVLLGFLLAVVYIVFVENPRYAKLLDKESGWLAPEQRLPAAILGGLFMPIVSTDAT